MDTQEQIPTEPKPASGKRTFSRAFDEKLKTLYFNHSKELQERVESVTEAGIIGKDDTISESIIKICKAAENAKEAEPLPEPEPIDLEAEFAARFRAKVEQYLPVGTIQSLCNESGGLTLDELFINIAVNWLCYQPCDLKKVAFTGKKETEEFLIPKKK